MPYDDLPLGRPVPPQLPRPRAASSISRWIIAAAAIIVAGGALYFWWLTRMPAQPATPSLTQATDVAVGTKRPSAQPIELPALGTSDALVRKIVSTLSQHPQLARFLATDQIISTTVLAVEQIGDGKTPAGPLKVLQPSTRLMILGADSGRIDPASYVRWQPDVDALTSVRPEEAAQVYVNLKPLFDQAYVDLGHAGGDFDTSLARAIRMLTSTPELTAEPVLMRRPAYFEHTDAALRALRPVQKQFLLLGRERGARLRSWLTSFAAAIDLKLG
jgi:hypothetical protein